MTLEIALWIYVVNVFGWLISFYAIAKLENNWPSYTLFRSICIMMGFAIIWPFLWVPLVLGEPKLRFKH